MSDWDSFPDDYRGNEVRAIQGAVRAGECVAVIGLSGAGKSNLLGFLARRQSPAEQPYCLVDCNRLAEPTPAALFGLIRLALSADSAPGESDPAAGWQTLADLLGRRLDPPGSSLCLLFDRFDALSRQPAPALFSNLRALRDEHKYRLTYVVAARRPLETDSELAELFFANTLWLGPLSEGDALWNVERFAARRGLRWDEPARRRLIEASGGYPALLRAVCEAHADGAAPDLRALSAHPAVKRRVEEFWADAPSAEAVRLSRLESIGLLREGRAAPAARAFDTARLTAKENLLLSHFLAHPWRVCEKDELIRAVWPEDKVFERGVRDDSLAQLVRRLREKIEPDASNPRYILTVPGRGYRFAQD